MFLKKQKRTLAFLLALVLMLTTFMSVAVFPASAEGDANYGVTINGEDKGTFESLSAALSGTSAVDGRVITVLQNEDKILSYTESCSIPSGTTLLIPFDDDRTVFTENNYPTRPDSGVYETPSNYMTLDMKAGYSLTIEDGGAICVGGQVYYSAGNNMQNAKHQGSPTGPNGRILMQEGSNITVENGGKLYAWGYIYGSSSDVQIEAESGASVYELFQSCGWRGTNGTAKALGDMTQGGSNGTFPFNQYYIQNIEVPVKINSGASEIVLASVHSDQSMINFIGDGGMFQINDGGYLIKDYDEANDRLLIESYGDSVLGDLAVQIHNMEVSTAMFDYLPLTNNITIDIKEGTVTVADNIALLPGTELNVDEGATVIVAPETNVFVMSAQDWVDSYSDGSGGTVDIVPISYTASSGGAPECDRTEEALPDADVDINGTAEVYGGFLTLPADHYTTGGVYSSEGTGTINYCPDTTDATILFYDPSSSGLSDVVFEYANIKQADGSSVDLVEASTTESGMGYSEFTMDGTVEKGSTLHKVYWFDRDWNTLSTGSYRDGEIPVYTGTDPAVPDGYSECIGWNTDDSDFETVEVAYGHAFPAVSENDDQEIYYFAAYKAVDSVFKMHSLSLDGSIGVNFYVDLPDGYTVEDATMDFVWGDKYIEDTYYEYDDTESYTMDVSGVVDGDYVKFTLPIAAKELSDTITATLKCGNDEYQEEYSGTVYAYKVLSMSNSELNALLAQTPWVGKNAELRATVISMLNYCSAAQNQFDYHTDELANIGLTAKQKEIAAVDTADLTDNDVTALTDLEYYGTSLNLGSETSYDICLINDAMAELTTSAAFTGDNGILNTSVRSNNIAYVVRVENLPAARITDNIDLTINGTSITVNTGAYIKAVLENKSEDDPLYKTVTALYAYNQSAKAYF